MYKAHNSRRYRITAHSSFFLNVLFRYLRKMSEYASMFCDIPVAPSPACFRVPPGNEVDNQPSWPESFCNLFPFCPSVGTEQLLITTCLAPFLLVITTSHPAISALRMSSWEEKKKEKPNTKTQHNHQMRYFDSAAACWRLILIFCLWHFPINNFVKNSVECILSIPVPKLVESGWKRMSWSELDVVF